LLATASASRRGGPWERDQGKMQKNTAGSRTLGVVNDHVENVTGFRKSP